MRGLIALCVGLVLVLGAGAAWGVNPTTGTCCRCSCPSGGSAFCVNSPLDAIELGAICSDFCEGTLKCETIFSPEVGAGGAGGDDDDDSPMPCDTIALCDGVPRFPQNPHPAPTASPYGIAALLIALGGFGAWRLRKRQAAA